MRRLLTVVVSGLLLAAPAGADPELNAFLKEIGFNDDEKKLMLAGRFIQKELDYILIDPAFKSRAQMVRCRRRIPSAGRPGSASGPKWKFYFFPCAVIVTEVIPIRRRQFLSRPNAPC